MNWAWKFWDKDKEYYNYSDFTHLVLTKDVAQLLDYLTLHCILGIKDGFDIETVGVEICIDNYLHFCGREISDDARWWYDKTLKKLIDVSALVSNKRGWKRERVIEACYSCREEEFTKVYFSCPYCGYIKKRFQRK